MGHDPTDQVYLYQEVDGHDQAPAVEDHLVDPSLDHHDHQAEDDLLYQDRKARDLVQDQVLVRVLHTYPVEDSLDPAVVFLYRNSFPAAAS